MIGNRKVSTISNMREDSKRIPDKCMKELNGIPLVSHTIGKLDYCGFVDKRYVSTSCQRYKDFVIATHDCEIIDRPEELSADGVHHVEVFKHAVSVLDMDDRDFLVFVDITKPFTKIDTIQDIIKKMYEDELDSCFTCKQTRHDLIAGNKGYYHFGAVRAYTKKTIRTTENIYGAGEKHSNLPIIGEFELDLDHPYDWIMAEALIKAGSEIE